MDKKVATDVKTTIDKDAQVTIQEIARTLDITSRSVSEILNYHLGYRKVCDQGVPQMLMPPNRRVQVAHSRAPLQTYDAYGLSLDEIVTGSQAWVCFCEPERKA